MGRLVASGQITLTTQYSIKPCGAYSPEEVYAYGNVVTHDGVAWLYVHPTETAGHAPLKRYILGSDGKTISFGGVPIGQVEYERAYWVLFTDRGEPGRDANMLDWVREWDTQKTMIDGNHILTPRLFAGEVTDNVVSGVLIGSLEHRGKMQNGVYGYEQDKCVFSLDKTGGTIGGWKMTEQGIGINNESGEISILSEGTIRSGQHWALKKDGSATFANGNIQLNNDGSAVFGNTLSIEKNGDISIEGIVTARGGEIGKWEISKNSIFRNGITLSSEHKAIGVGPDMTADGDPLQIASDYGGVAMFYKERGNYGILGKRNARIDFSLGNLNMIGGWYFDHEAIYLGVKSNVAKSKPNGITIGTEGIRGNGWYIDRDGEAAFANGNVKLLANGNAEFVGKVTSGSGQIGGWTIDRDAIYMGTKNNATGYALTNSITIGTNGLRGSSWYIEKSGTVSFKAGRIGPWIFTTESLFKGSQKNTAGTFTDAPGDFTIGSRGLRGHTWRLDEDGRGAIAKGKLSWDENGNVTVADDFSLSVVSGMKIGGRNLARGTSREGFDPSRLLYTGWSTVPAFWSDTEKAMVFCSNNGWQTSTMELSEVLNDEEVVISYDLKGLINFEALKVSVNIGEKYDQSLTNMVSVKTGWVHHEYRTTGRGNKVLVMIRGADNSGLAYKAYVRNLKVEKGNKATAWSPAPEDGVTKGNVIASINASAEGVTIDAKKVTITGSLVAGAIQADGLNINGNFNIDKKGNVFLRGTVLQSMISKTISEYTNDIHMSGYCVVEINRVNAMKDTEVTVDLLIGDQDYHHGDVIRVIVNNFRSGYGVNDFITVPLNIDSNQPFFYSYPKFGEYGGSRRITVPSGYMAYIEMMYMSPACVYPGYQTGLFVYNLSFHKMNPTEIFI